MCKDKTDFVISGGQVRASQDKSEQVRTSQDRNDPPPSLLVGVVKSLVGTTFWSPSTVPPTKKIWRLTEHQKILVPKAPDLGQKIKVLGSNFFVDGSTHLISLADFPGKKSGERSRKTEKFLRKVQFFFENWKKTLKFQRFRNFRVFKRKSYFFI